MKKRIEDLRSRLFVLPISNAYKCATIALDTAEMYYDRMPDDAHEKSAEHYLELAEMWASKAPKFEGQP